jgi:NhaA family Na+:H+ antiporter
MLGGIGFTMSLFISGLSFSDPMALNLSKIGVLGGSILSAAAGLAFLAAVAARDGRTYAEAAEATS